jgi:hypothetical protein
MQCDASFDDRPFKVNMQSRKCDIRSGTIYQRTQEEIAQIDSEAALIGLMLSVDDTKLTQHSGNHNGRPLYLATANQSLHSRRHLNTNAWRITALLPTLDHRFKDNTAEEDAWKTIAKSEFANRCMELALKPLIGMC